MPVASTRSSTVSRRIVPSSIPPIIRPEHDDAGVGFRPVGAGHGREQPGCGRRLPPFGVDDPAAVVEVVGSAGGVETCGDQPARPTSTATSVTVNPGSVSTQAGRYATPRDSSH